MDKPVIAAFDVATSTGVCWGWVGRKVPDIATWNMRAAGPLRSRRLHLFFTYCEDLFMECASNGYRVDQVWYEAPLNIAVMQKIGASEETVALLRGMIGVLEVCAVRAGVKDIKSFAVQDARKHLTGQRRFAKKNEGKAEVMRIARMLGVEVEDDNQADAFAGWSYACGLANPRLAHLVTPLWAGT